MPYLFSKTSKIRIYELKFFKLLQCQYLLWFLISVVNDAFVSAMTAKACFMVPFVCLFMKTHLLALLQDNCLDLVCCTFFRKLSACVRNFVTIEADKIGCFSWYQCIGKTQVLARYINLSLFLSITHTIINKVWYGQPGFFLVIDWNISQNGQNLPHLQHHSQKTQNQKFFSLQTRRLARSFGGLNSSVTQLTGELRSGAKLATQCMFFYIQYICTSAANVLMSWKFQKGQSWSQDILPLTPQSCIQVLFYLLLLFHTFH